MYPWPGSTLVRICGASSATGACATPAASAARAQIADHTTAIPTSTVKVGYWRTSGNPLGPGGCLPDTRTVRWRTIPGVLAGPASFLEGLPHRGQQLLRQAGLLQGSGRPGGESGGLVVDAEAGGQRQDWQGRKAGIRAKPPQHREPGQPWQRDG